MKKVVRHRWRQKNGCNGRSVTKNLITTIQVNFVSIPSEVGTRQSKFTQIVIIKFFVTNLPLQLVLGLYFAIFLILAILHRATPFLQLGCFCIDTIITHHQNFSAGLGCNVIPFSLLLNSNLLRAYELLAIPKCKHKIMA